MSDIKMSLDDTLELDAIIQEWDPNSNDIIKVTSNKTYDLNGIKKHTGVFNPTESGEHTIEINGQILTIEVIDDEIIPDSVSDDLIHAYIPTKFTSSKWPDLKGNSDIDDIVGLSYNKNLFNSNGGVEGNGNDGRGLSSIMGSYGSKISEGSLAIAFGFSTTDDFATLFGTLNSGGSGVEVGIGRPYKVPSNKLGCGIRYKDVNSGGNADNNVNTSIDMNDGSEHAIIFNKTGGGANSMEIYTSPTTTDTNVAINNGLQEGASDYNNPVAYHAVNNSGSISSNNSGVLNSVYWFKNSLNQKQRKDVFDQLFDWYDYQ